MPTIFTHAIVPLAIAGAAFAILPDEWSAKDMDEHHLLLKKLGQSHCRPRKAECNGCPALDDCDTGYAQQSD
ncbi:MAG: hypothetical protein ABJ239_06185 [Erythrobacter sp.]